jgi:hypothetical protein
MDHGNVQHNDYYPDATKRLIAKLKKAGYHNVKLDSNSKALTENLNTIQIIAQKSESLAGQNIAVNISAGQGEVSTSGNLHSGITIKVGKDLSESKQDL